jgi:Na+/serine symporter
LLVLLVLLPPPDARALAGCDYLVLTAKVMADLESSPTLQVRLLLCCVAVLCACGQSGTDGLAV